MTKTKRPLLLLGLVITTILSLFYIFSQIIAFTSWIILVLFIAVFFFNIAAFKTINMTKKDFKRGKWFSWASIFLIFIYDIFEYIIIIRKYHSTGYVNVVKVALLFITLFALLLKMCGILTRVIDNKITYEEHLKK